MHPDEAASQLAHHHLRVSYLLAQQAIELRHIVDVRCQQAGSRRHHDRTARYALAADRVEQTSAHHARIAQVYEAIGSNQPT